MKKPLESLPLKITAVLLSYVMIVTLILSVAAVAVMGYFNFYFTSGDSIEQDLLGDMAYNETHDLAVLYDLGRDLEYNYAGSNIYYTIERPDGTTVVSNFNGEDIVAAEQYYGEDYIYTVYVADNMTKTDKYSVIRQFIRLGYNLRYAFVFIAFFSLIAFIVLLCFLYCAAGHKKGFSEIKLNYLDLIPTDVYAAFTVFAFVMSFLIINGVFYEGLEVVIVMFSLGTLLYFLLLGFTMSVATRIKTRSLFKNTVFFKLINIILNVLGKIGKAIGYFFSKLPFIWKTVLALAVIIFVEVFYLAFNLHYTEGIVWGFIIFNFLFVIAILYVAITLHRIKLGGEKIAAGDLNYKINTNYMVLDFKEFSQNLNSINDGLQVALSEKMKSERFKTELITNVSHDIKTPLTSIINYVDLLKKQDIKNETANEYIDVLDRQSVRLKKLIEDLVEASKASTGNLSVDLAPCDIGVLLSQTLGEFDEKFKKAGIIPVLKTQRDNVIIKADARHLWRVIDNLLNNICKYSQNNTRVYIDVSVAGNKAAIAFKNISRYELNISSEELMERFVRGDKSRHTDGSGLGLSIARSLTELQNGRMNIEVDGDLFKVTLEFDVEVK